MSWRAITTCNRRQWTDFGWWMAQSYLGHWPLDVPLRVYAEGFEDPQGPLEIVDLNMAVPWLAAWKASCGPVQRGMTRDGYRYRFDAVKFAHKVAALGAAIEENGDGILIWLDADTVTHAPVTKEWLASLLPDDADLGWLDRERKYPECGFMMFRLPEARQVIADVVRVYRDGSVFDMSEWHDSFVIETVAKAAEALGLIKIASLSGEGRAHHHVLANSPIGERLDHLKGDRKEKSRTPKSERRVVGGGAYWR